MSHNICVFCASSDHIEKQYVDDAVALGKAIAHHGDTLIYGGGGIGLMGQLARSVHQHHGKVVGVIPEAMMSTEVAYHDADELVTTHTMRQRKQIMDDRADAFITLPGGFGSLEELVEHIVLRILDYHRKPIAIVNSHGFYDPLLELFEHFYEHQFAKRKDVYHVSQDSVSALDYIHTQLR